MEEEDSPWVTEADSSVHYHSPQSTTGLPAARFALSLHMSSKRKDSQPLKAVIASKVKKTLENFGPVAPVPRPEFLLDNSLL